MNFHILYKWYKPHNKSTQKTTIKTHYIRNKPSKQNSIFRNRPRQYNTCVASQYTLITPRINRKHFINFDTSSTSFCRHTTYSIYARNLTLFADRVFIKFSSFSQNIFMAPRYEELPGAIEYVDMFSCLYTSYPFIEHPLCILCMLKIRLVFGKI